MPELYRRHQLRLHGAEERLAFALADAIPGLSRSKARQAICAGVVQVDGRVVADPTALLEAEQVQVVCDLSQGLRTQQQGGRRFQILYQDPQLLVVDKAAGLLSAPMKQGDHGHLPELVRNHLRKQGQSNNYLGLVHRLDKETSGCLVLALTRKSQELLSAQFASHSAQRRYRCLVLGQPVQDSDTLQARLGRGHDGRRWIVPQGAPGKDAVTHFRVLRRFKRGAELEVHLETGRTHQIRIHLASIGCPVAGDPLYCQHARRQGKLRGIPRANRLMLHAASLAFDHPQNGERLDIDSPPPQAYQDYAHLLDR